MQYYHTLFRKEMSAVGAVMLFFLDFLKVEVGEQLLRLVIACFCGTAIGLERTKRYKEAGIRTHVIVCCASALLMIISKYVEKKFNYEAKSQS